MQLLDPDGLPNKTQLELYEEQLAAQILKKRREAQERKLKSKKLKKKLEESVPVEEIIEQVNAEIIAEEPKYPFTPEVEAEVNKILNEQYESVKNEFEAAVRALYDTSVALKRQQEEMERELLLMKKKKLQRKRAMKVLFLLANMDDEE